MTLDGFCFTALTKELNDALAGSRVEQFYWADNGVFARFRAPGRTLAVHFSLFSPPFCLYLADSGDSCRQNTPLTQSLANHLCGKFCIGIDNPPFDRWAIWDFSDKPGGEPRLQLHVEVMGRQNHLTLTRDGTVLAASRKRPHNQPGHSFVKPPRSDKLNPLRVSPSLVHSVFQAAGDKELSKALVAHIFGVSPLLAAELAFRAGIEPTLPAGALSADQCRKLATEISSLAAKAVSGSSEPVLYWQEGVLRTWYWQQLTHLRPTPRRLDSISEAIASNHQWHRVTGQLNTLRSGLIAAINTAAARLKGTLVKQQQELAKAQNHEQFRQLGDTLLANLHQVKPGQKHAVLINPHTDKPVTIALDPNRPPSDNAARYYKKHSRLKNAAGKISRQMEAVRENLSYLESLLYAAEVATDPADIQEVYREMAEQGLSKRQHPRRQPSRRNDFVKLTSPTGDVVLVGKNNRQNEQLTLRKADKNHIWLHVRDYPGSHVVLCNPSPQQQSLLFAASAAAWYSRARQSDKVEVVWTRVRDVKKIPGSKPGMVQYVNYKSLIVDPRHHRNTDGADTQ